MKTDEGSTVTSGLQSYSDVSCPIHHFGQVISVVALNGSGVSSNPVVYGFFLPPASKLEKL